MSISQLITDINEFVMDNVKRKMTEMLKKKLTKPINDAVLVPEFNKFLEEQFNDDFLKHAKAANITTAEIAALLNPSTSGGRAKKKTRKRKLSRPRRATLGKNKGGAKKVRAFRMNGGGNGEEDNILQAYTVPDNIYDDNHGTYAVNVQPEEINPYQRPNYSLREYEYIIKNLNEYIEKKQDDMAKFKEKLLKEAKEPLKNLLMCVLEEHFVNVLTRDFKEYLSDEVVMPESKTSVVIKNAVDDVQLYKTIWETKKNESLQKIVDDYNKISKQIPGVNP